MAIVLLSIVIPTKERFSYLVSCLQSLLKIDSNKIEIIVHDNSSENKRADLVMALENEKFTYYHTTDKLSGVDNFDAAIRKAIGKYVMVIGDDDSCSGKIISAVEQLDKENLDAMLFPKAIYFWPDISFRYFSNKFSGQLFVNSFTGKEKLLDAIHQRNMCLKSGACEILALPRVYHGVVKKEVLEKVRSISKVYSPGPSPDIANAIALTHVINTYKYIDIPFVITGNAAKSGAGMGAAGKHIGKIGAVSFLPENAENTWSGLVPRFWSGQTVWAQSVISAMKSCGNNSYQELLNLPLLHAKTYVFNAAYRPEVMRNYWGLISENKLSWTLKFIWCWIYAQTTRIQPFLIKIPYLLGCNKSLNQQRFKGLKTINDASFVLDQVLNKFNKT